MQDLEQVRAAFVQLWTRMGPFWGITPGAARVYGQLLSEAEPIDADGLMQALGMSRGAVSMACRELADWGLVVPEKRAGERRVLWRAETDAERAMKAIVQSRKRREWDPVLEHLRAWIPELASDRSREAQVFRERLEALEALVATVDSMAESFLKGGVVQSLGLKLLSSAIKTRSPSKSKRALV
jgi:DNA-binding transcriptional regulator GbsR (MarR family)